MVEMRNQFTDIRGTTSKTKGPSGSEALHKTITSEPKKIELPTSKVSGLSMTDQLHQNEQEKQQYLDLDQDYPFRKRTPLYRNLQTLCSKTYLMHSISNHYSEKTFAPEKTGMLRPNTVLAGFATRAELEEDLNLDEFSVPLGDRTPDHL